MSVTLRSFRLRYVDVHVYRGDTKVLDLYDYHHHFNYVTNNALVRCKRGEYIETKANLTSSSAGYLRAPQSIFTVMSVHQEGNYKEYMITIVQLYTYNCAFIYHLSKLIAYIVQTL